MDKVIRISSQQGFSDSFTNATKPSNLNLLDFVIPSGMNIDLSKSYIAINSQITSSTAAPVNVYQYLDVDNNERYNIPNSALVRNCSISNNQGQVESIRRLDTLNCGLFGLTETAEERKSNLNTLSTFPGPRGVGNRTSYMLDAITDNVDADGTTVNTAHTSRQLSRDIKIPLKEMFGMCVSEAYSTDKFGETRIHVETNFVKGSSSALKSIVLGGDERTSLMFDATNNYGDMGAQNNIPIGDSTGKLIGSGTYENWQLVCPFFVGQEVQISADVVGGAGATITDQAATITSIQYQQDNRTTPNGNQLVHFGITPALYVNNVLGVQVNVDNIAMKAKTDATLTTNINRAELVLHTSMEQPDDDIVFNTYTTEEDNGNSLTSFNRQYIVEPEASGLFVAVCNDGDILPNRTFESYRYSVNNEEMTSNRDIPFNSPIQYDRLQRCLDRQLGLGFKNAQLKFIKNDNAQTASAAAPVSMICETLPQTEMSKKVGVAIECTAQLQQIILYKSMEKKISA